MTLRERAEVLIARRLGVAELLRDVRQGKRQVQAHTGAYILGQLDAEARSLREHAQTRAQWAAGDGWTRTPKRLRCACVAEIVEEAEGTASVGTTDLRGPVDASTSLRAIPTAGPLDKLGAIPAGSQGSGAAV